MPGNKTPNKAHLDKLAAKIKRLDELSLVSEDRLIDEQWNERRLRKLAEGRKPHVVFFCNRTEVWGVLESVYQAFLADSRFSVSLVYFPYKRNIPGIGWAHDEYVDNGVSGFYGRLPRAISGYDRATGTWLDLKSLEPDYVFFQDPYQAARPHQYNSSLVSSYAKICYVPYGLVLHAKKFADWFYLEDFLSDVSFFFCETPFHYQYTLNRFKEFKHHKDVKIILSGDTATDELAAFTGSESSLWKFSRSAGKFRVLWTPRWSLSENSSHFLEYKDKFINFCQARPEFEIIFRPHPGTFGEMVSKRKMTAQEVEKFKREVAGLPNATLDLTPDYLETVFSADAIVTDISSMMWKYAQTGRPVIYTHKVNCFNELGESLSRGFYWAESWDHVSNVLFMLKDGKDPKKAKRLTVMQHDIYKPEGLACEIVKRTVAQDFFDPSDNKESSTQNK